MNLFEKIFNYQIISRLEDSGTFIVTAHERAWLKNVLQHPAAAAAFTPATLDKLSVLLEQEDTMNTAEHLIEKARSVEHQVYHPLLRTLRRLIMNKNAFQLSYRNKSGELNAFQYGYPYKLEYSMVKREWYLLWYHLKRHSFMSIKLKQIESVTEKPIPQDRADHILKRIDRILDSRRTDTVIEIVPAYIVELSRILYAFACFEKDVTYNAEQDIYRVRICYMADEAEYLLSKIRFLGLRVRVIEGDYLKKRMLEATTKSLARYEADAAAAREEQPAH
ncbi:WYL domain-containing protein [Paenibacillus marinisediminis]